jgi:signal peptidase I
LEKLFALIFQDDISEKIEENNISVDWKKKILFGVIVINLIIFNMFFPLMVVKGESMEPTLSNGQVGICLDWVKNPIPISFGDIITFDRAFGYNKKSLIKRVIGLPGDHIRITSEGVYRNNELLIEEYLSPNTITSPNMDIELFENEYFVLGDNRESSADSRIFGKVKSDSIIAKLLWTY